MLETIDILIGVSVVMLVLSLPVTAITQFVMGVFNTRGRNLRGAIDALLQQVDTSGLDAPIRGEISQSVLKHPSISSAYGRLGDVIHRDEFCTIVMELAAGSGPMRLSQNAELALKATLQNSGVADPEDALRQIRGLAMELEKVRPDLSHNARMDYAILQQAGSDFVARINEWFDQTIDRASSRFTATARVWTFAAAVVVAFGLQVSTIDLVNRLSTDQQFREKLAAQASSVAEAAKKAGISGTTTDGQQENGATDQSAGQGAGAAGATAPVSNGQAVGSEEPSDAKSGDVTKILSAAGILSVPSDWSDLRKVATTPDRFLGELITALLLTMGAPFWFRTLQSLIQLRSVIAQKDDVQRDQRQKTQDSSPGAGTMNEVAPILATGEHGDLTPVG